MQAVVVNQRPVTFKELATSIYDAGLLRRRKGYYSLKIALTVLAFGAGWAGLVLLGNSWLTLLVAAFLGLMFTQLGFLGHDAGHQQVFGTRRANSMLGMTVGNALIGVSFGWWVPKHSAHHAFPNQVGRDPDLDAALVPPDLVAAPPRPRGRVSNLMSAWQAWLFFPLLLLRSTGLHFLGIRRLLQNRDRAAALEGLLIGAHFAVYVTTVLWVLSPLKALAFVAVQQGVFSVYLGCSFAPNHKGMSVIAHDAQLNFARRQVTTSRNVKGGRLTSFALGGLNYQIEHHLFPSMPRPNLGRAQALVRSFCLESGLGYCEESFVGSFRTTLRQMRSVTKESSIAAERFSHSLG